MEDNQIIGVQRVTKEIFWFQRNADFLLNLYGNKAFGSQLAVEFGLLVPAGVVEAPKFLTSV